MLVVLRAWNPFGGKSKEAAAWGGGRAQGQRADGLSR